jgi:diguanylate cyclase (GGDEF)-like protein/PAS domain S-box-containing protein
MRATIWAYYLAGMAGLIGAYLFLSPLKGNALVVEAVGIGSLAAMQAGFKLHRARAKLAWRLLLAGQALFVAAIVYTHAYPDLFGRRLGFPSPAEAIHLCVYPALFAGLVVLVRRRDPEALDRAGVLDSVVITIGFGLLSWVFLIVPAMHLSSASPLAKTAYVAYPLGDLLVLAAVLRFAVQAAAKSPAFTLLFTGTTLLLGTDYAHDYSLVHHTSHHQSTFDASWLVYLVLWGAAALHPSMDELERPAQIGSTRLTTPRLGLLAMACLIAPAIHFVEEIDNADMRFVIGASGILFLLVVLRVAGLARLYERTAKREVTMRSAGLALVEAVGRARVHEEAVSSVSRVAGEEASVRLVRWTETGSEVVASNGGGTWQLTEGTSDWLKTQRTAKSRVATASPADPIATALGLGAFGPTLVVRLSVPDQDQGALVVRSPLELGADVVDSLEALASQVSLALEAASLAENLHRQKSEARFRSLVAHSTDLITVLDQNGIITYQSPSIEALLGRPPAEIEGRPFADFVDEGDRARLERILQANGSHTFECVLRHADGRQVLFEVRQTRLLEDEHVQGIVLNSRDVSERKAFEDQLAHQAFHDPVTGLANRALFTDRVGHALRSTVRKGSLIAVMFIDLDDFKMVNDSLGHQAGDHVLIEVARRLERTVRPADTVARFGGDEFAVLLDGIESSDEAAIIADRLLVELEAPTDVEGRHVYPRGSIGICISDQDLLSQDTEELLRNADLAMYMAKRDSKGRYELFEPTMHDRVVERLELRSKLQVALAKEQLEVYYQPVVRIGDGRRYGVEALLRWNHPENGLVTPSQFISLAEETGLIESIGKWVIEQACAKGTELQVSQPEPLRISVNLSVRQLHSEQIVDIVRNALETSGLEPSSLVLEVTESVMLADADVAVERLHALKELGVKIAMDDFGTGYSSLSYLSRLPVDILKMDRSFLAEGNADSGLVAAIMAIGERLGLEVVAEGIERQDQIESLQSLGFALGQGFLFGGPVPGHVIEAHLSPSELPAQDGAPGAGEEAGLDEELHRIGLDDGLAVEALDGQPAPPTRPDVARKSRKRRPQPVRARIAKRDE